MPLFFSFSLFQRYFYNYLNIHIHHSAATLNQTIHHDDSSLLLLFQEVAASSIRSQFRSSAGMRITEIFKKRKERNKNKTTMKMRQ